MRWMVTLFMLLLFSVVQTSAQRIKDPTSWSFQTEKIGEDTYKLIFHVTLQDGWHIFTLQPGDEFLIPPSFSFEQQHNVKLVGSIVEEGQKITSRFEGLDNPVHYYEGDARFIQKVQVKGKPVITGKYEYQVCNDQMCLPPETKEFSFTISE